MNATPPEAKTEYSRAGGASRDSNRPETPVSGGIHWTVSATILVCGVVGAALLIVAEFATLYAIHTAARRSAISTVTVSSHNTWAMIPIAVLAGLLTVGAARDRNRPALIALGALGVIALLIALVGDLPDSESTGILLQGGSYVAASSSPSAGMYLETAGAVLLLIAAGTGLLLGGPPPRRRRRAQGGRRSEAAHERTPTSGDGEPGSLES
jgi:hypothetical protein